jgi:hypothetical protein
MTGAELSKQQPVVATPASRYVAPWMRKSAPKEEKKGLTAEEMASTEMFPTLKPMNPGTSTGATWSQISTRLAQPLSMKAAVEEAIERERLALEEGIRQEQETDPSKMTPAQLEANGWVRLTIPKTREEWLARMEKAAKDAPRQEPEPSEWGLSPFTEEAMNNPDLYTERFRAMCSDGKPTRTKSYFS